MKFAILASALATLAASASVDLSRRDSPLDLQLSMAGNTMVKATLKNKGNTDLKVLKTGTILDNVPVEKVSVFAANNQLEFAGVRVRVAVDNLDDDDFQVIPAGGSVTFDVEVSATHDLSAGGKFNFKSVGYLPVASMNGSTIEDLIQYTSNTVSGDVDGLLAAAAHENSVVKRFQVQNDCQGQRKQATETAIKNCRGIAANAAKAAMSNKGKVVEYFKNAGAANTVAQVFQKVAQQCSSVSQGIPYHCADVLKACGKSTLAYTLPAKSFIVNCPLFFEHLQPVNKKCHAQDQASTILHEATHLKQVKGTTDFGSYGYAGIKKLTAEQNLNHADTYTLFAQSLYAENCNPKGE